MVTEKMSKCCKENTRNDNQTFNRNLEMGSDQKYGNVIIFHKKEIQFYDFYC